jgi:hypothetical protein
MARLCRIFRAGQGFTNALPLVRRQHRNKSKAVPVPSAIRNGQRGESNMPYHAAMVTSAIALSSASVSLLMTIYGFMVFLFLFLAGQHPLSSLDPPCSARRLSNGAF